MFVFKSNVNIGYSSGRIVLIDAAGDEETRYLTIRSSMLLIALININKEIERYEFLVDNNIAPDKVTAKRMLQKFIPTILEFVYELDDFLPIDSSKLRKINIQKLTKYANEKNLNQFRLDFPASIVWVPTWKCNRSCTYCGVAKIRPDADEKRLSKERVYHMIDELIELGISSISIHGGEPLFLYDEEIYSILKYLSTNGISYISISTKNHITKEMAKRLKDCGLRELQLSLDATDDDVLYKIYGEKNYLSKFESSVKHLQAEGIKVKVNIVASQLNYKYIPKLLVYLNNLLINVVTMSPYRLGPVNTIDYSLSEKEADWLGKEIMNIRDTFVFDKRSLFTKPTTQYKAYERPVCEAGRMSMLFLPDGSGCYCDYLSEKRNFIFGNLENQSIEEIWHSQELIKFLNPDRKEFIGTICYECKQLSLCLKKGLCYLQTPIDRTYGPDFKCAECTQCNS